MRGGSDKLKLSLKLLLQRIKSLSLKKQSLSASVRKDIANLISDGKHESARIRVEGVIREDYLIEAFEVIGLLSEVLIARYGLLDHPTTAVSGGSRSHGGGVVCDVGIQEAVHTLLYATPRCLTDLKEMQQITQYLRSKFGRDFCEAASSNRSGLVNARVVSRLGVERPPDELVTAYLREICKSYGVQFDEEAHSRSISAFGAIGTNTAQNVPLHARGSQPLDLQSPVMPPQYASAAGVTSPNQTAQTSGQYVNSQSHLQPQNSQLHQQSQQQQQQYQQQQHQQTNVNEQQQQASGPVIPQLPPQSDDEHDHNVGMAPDFHASVSRPDGHDVEFPSAPSHFNADQPQPPQQNETHDDQDVQASDDPGFDELAKRFEMLKKSKR